MNRNILIVVIAAFIGLMVGGFGTYFILQKKHKEFKKTIERQLRGDLTKIEQKLQTANQDLHTVNSELVEEKILRSSIENNLLNTKKEKEQMERLLKEYEIDVESSHKIIAELKSTTEEGIGMLTDTDPCSLYQKPIPYTYTLLHKNKRTNRILLEDPDICNNGDEKLTLHQAFSIRAIIYGQEDGALKTEQVWVDEIDPITNERIGSLKVDPEMSEFKYTPPNLPPVEVPPFTTWAFQWFKFSNPNILVSYDTKNAIGIGLEFLRFWRLGTNFRYNHSLDMGEDKLNSHRLSAGLVYHIGWGNKETNVGVGGSISTPANKMGDSWLGTAEVTFDLLK